MIARFSVTVCIWLFTISPAFSQTLPEPEVHGYSLGMAAEEFKKKLVAEYGEKNVSKHCRQIPDKDPYCKFKAKKFSTDRSTSFTMNDIYAVLHPVPSPYAVGYLTYGVVYRPEAYHLDEVKASLIEKYGKPSQDKALGYRWMAWLFDKNGNFLSGADSRQTSQSKSLYKTCSNFLSYIPSSMSIRQQHNIGMFNERCGLSIVAHIHFGGGGSNYYPAPTHELLRTMFTPIGELKLPEHGRF